MIDVGIKETTATTGTGTVTLAAVVNHARVSQAFGVDSLVSYCLISGNGDKEWGIGTVGAGNTLARSIISATLIGTTYTKNGSAISLTGTSDLIVTENGASVASGALYLKTPGGAAGWFCPYMVSAGSLNTFTLSSNRVVYIPFQMQAALFAITVLGLEVTTLVAGSTVQLALYDSAIVSGVVVPGVRIENSTFDSSTTGVKTSAINFTPRPGAVYWIAVSSAFSPVIRGISAAGVTGMRFGNQLAAVNPVFFVQSVGSATPNNASAESFTPISSGGVPALFIGQ